MNIALWVVQGLLALAFLMAGLMKVSRPKQQLYEAGMTYVEDLSEGTTKIIGMLEIAGAIGLILPALTGILPILTPLAAVGLALTMIGAMLTHIRRNEYIPQLVVNAILGGLAIFVIYGRFALEPIV